MIFFTAPAPTTTGSNDAMSILDTITSLNQEAIVRASSSTDKGRKTPAADEAMHLGEEKDEDMSVEEEGENQLEGKVLEETVKGKETSDVQMVEVKKEDTQEQPDVGRRVLTDDVKVEDEESECHDPTKEEKDNTTGDVVPEKPLEENCDEEHLKSTSQARLKARERIKEGECPDHDATFPVL